MDIGEKIGRRLTSLDIGATEEKRALPHSSVLVYGAMLKHKVILI
jgi:hypothetical protein